MGTEKGFSNLVLVLVIVLLLFSSLVSILVTALSPGSVASTGIPPGQGQVSALGGDRADYLVITEDIFYDNIQPLADWKREKGLEVKVVTLNDILSWAGSITSWDETIRDYIKNAYENWDLAPSYVLLVGDVEYLPTHYETYHFPNVATDHYYSCVAGDDYFSDVFVGRISVKGNDELKVIVNKIVEYENNPYLAGNWYRKAVLIADHDDPPHIFEATKDWVYNILTVNGYSADKLYEIDGNATTADIRAAINDGRALVNYCGHGNITGWSAGPFDLTDVLTLMNGRKLPVVFSLACDTGYFDYGDNDCLGEAWLKAENGGVGFFGSTRASLTEWNHELDKGIYKAIFNDNLRTLGEVTAKAKLYMYNALHENDENATELMFYEYNILGDPELSILPFNLPPNEPSSPIPENGATEVNTSPTLSVYVSDPDGDSMDVTFYNASDDSAIGTVTNVPSGGTTSVLWSGLACDTTYSWYAVADDGMATTRSPMWSFTIASIVYGVDVSVSPSDWYGNVGGVVDIPVTVTNTGNIEDTYDLWAYNFDTENYQPVSPTPITIPAGESRTATITATIPEDASVGEEYDLYVGAMSQTDGSIMDAEFFFVHVVFVINSTFYPSDDADVSSAYPDEVRNNDIMGIGRVFLKFDLSSIPQDAIVMSASLHLRVGGAAYEWVYSKTSGRYYLMTWPRSSVSGPVYGVEDDSWSEETITWNNQPPLGDWIGSSSMGGDWTNWDVTSWVKDQISGDASFCIIYPRGIVFASKELLDIGGPEGDTRPYLVIACGEE